MLTMLFQTPIIGGDVLQPGDINPGSVADFFLLLLKLGFVVAGLLYVVFAIVVVRQITVMRRTVSTSLSTQLHLLGLAHLFFSIGVVVWLMISL